MFKNTQCKWQRRGVTVAVLLALLVVMLGAYTRLTHAGLGCPDWPGCYGHLLVKNQDSLNAVETRKAWTEMIHRYAAGTLALLIFSLGIYTLRQRFQSPKTPIKLYVLLMGLVIFQAALGMWTVTMKLLPVVVMAHLLGGCLIFSLLVRLRAEMSAFSPTELSAWRFWVGLGGVIVFCQIALGGWVSANYAGIACIGFPQCNGQWWPQLHLTQSFYLFSPVGENYQGGVLDNEARVTIQWVHRLGAFITTTYILGLSTCLILKTKNNALRWIAGLSMLFVSVQVMLGIINVLYLLPISIAVMHNGVAALLLATLVVMFYLTQRRA